jgi:hypothetical protein
MIETVNDGLMVSEFIDHLYSLGIAGGYHPSAIADAMYEKGESAGGQSQDNNELYNE